MTTGLRGQGNGCVCVNMIKQKLLIALHSYLIQRRSSVLSLSLLFLESKGQRHMIIKCISAVWHHELVGK